jgi:tripartite-type tricarboxylate transporter receptor subunit TctC
MFKRSLIASTMCLAFLSAPSHAQQSFPSRAITIVVPFTAGGGSDIVTRIVGQKLGEVLGVPVVIDNRAGAGGTVGSGMVARAAADGYTLISLTTSTHAIAPAIYPKLAYDPVTDFEPVGLIGTSPYVLAVPATERASDLKTFIAEAKASAAPRDFASAGVGTLAHLVGEQFCRQSHIKCVHVPYQGEAASFADLISGAVSFSFFNPIGLVQHVRSGKLKAIAQTSRSGMLPTTPTFAELGVANFNHELWLGLAAPKGTPPAVITRLNTALAKVLAEPAVVADLDTKGLAAKSSTPTELKARISTQKVQWGQVVKEAGVKLD